MNRRSFLKGLGAAMAAVQLLQRPVPELVMEVTANTKKRGFEEAISDDYGQTVSVYISHVFGSDARATYDIYAGMAEGMVQIKEDNIYGILKGGG